MLCMYMYIYTYIHVCVTVYIYIMGNHQANSTAKFYKLPSFPPRRMV